MVNWVLIIIMVAAVTAAYLVGVSRGVTETERKYAHEYDRGYVAGMNWAEKRMRREANGREMLSQLEDLWEEDNILDAGEY